jgi:hypothetical protein
MKINAQLWNADVYTVTIILLMTNAQGVFYYYSVVSLYTVYVLTYLQCTYVYITWPIFIRNFWGHYVC